MGPNLWMRVLFLPRKTEVASGVTQQSPFVRIFAEIIVSLRSSSAEEVIKAHNKDVNLSTTSMPPMSDIPSDSDEEEEATEKEKGKGRGGRENKR